MQDSSIGFKIGHLSEIPPFVIGHCPGIGKAAKRAYNSPYSPQQTYWEKLSSWYANVGSKLASLHAEATRDQGPSHNISLFTIWEATKQEWRDLMQQVGCMGCPACYGGEGGGDMVGSTQVIGACPSAGLNTHHAYMPTHPPGKHNLVQAKGPRGWTKDLSFKCSALVLKSCIVGLWMPPLRQGMLRVMHNLTHHSDACVYEHCK